MMLARLCAALILLATTVPAFAHEGHADGNKEAPPSTEPSMRGNYGGPFILQDQTGHTVTDEDYHGKFLLLTFGYTSCADICPTLVQTMVQAVDLLGDKGAQVQPLFITLDPARDTPAKLTEYVTAFHPRLVGLTGPQDYVASAARKYRIRVEKVENKDGTYGFNHTAVIFLMGPDGAFLDRFPMNIPAEKIADRIKKRMAEPPKPAE